MLDTMANKVNRRIWYFVHALTGVHLSSPTRYKDWSMMGASFTASIERVQERLPLANLKPVESIPGSATVVLKAFEVRKAANLPPYNEFSVEIPVVYEGENMAKGLQVSFILHMPVTREEARWGGVDIYGLPKFIANISFEEEEEVRRCKVKAEEREVITLEVKKVPAKAASWDWYLYGVRDGQLIMSHIKINGQRGVSDTLGGGSFRLGDHPISDNLRLLEIDNISVGHEYSPKLDSLEDNPIIVTPLRH